MASKPTQKSKKTNKSFLEALRSVRSYIEENYPDGGWLPPEREISSKLGICRTTYTKTVRTLEKEGFLRSYPRKGHQALPEFLRVKKVGIIIGDARISPYVQDGASICSLIQALETQHIFTHILQATDHDSILDQALICGVLGLIWFNPSEQICPYLNDIHNNSDLPILAVSATGLFETLKPDFNFVAPDFRAIAETKADHLIQRKHCKIAYIGSKPPLFYDVFTEKLETAGIEAQFIPNDINGIPADLSSLSDTSLSGLMFDGGTKEIVTLFNDLSSIDHKLKDLYIFDTSINSLLKTRFPDIKPTALGQNDSTLLGATAAEIMINHLLKEQPLTTQRVNYYKIATDFKW